MPPSNMYSLRRQLQNSTRQQNRPFEPFCRPAAEPYSLGVCARRRVKGPKRPRQTDSKSSIFLARGVLQLPLRAGARSSPLSRAQFEEIRSLFPAFALKPVWAESPGDRDRTTSLRTLGKTDFFTRDLDRMLLAGKIEIAIHSAKDLPDPMPDGLAVVYLSPGLDPRDSLVLRQGESLKSGARIATSSARREDAVRTICPGAIFLDLRGTIEERIGKLEKREADGVVVAEAALIRLRLTHLNRIFLPGETTPLQGKLAIVARVGDEEIKRLFHDSLHRH